MAESSYGERLKAAMLQKPVSRRRLSFLLADATGNKQPSEYRALGKYLADDELPSPDRAGILAKLTGTAALASVPSNGDRRRGRQAELEARVGELERLLELLAPRLDQVVDRVSALEKQAPPKRAASARRSAG